jgi:hypothetical protein
MNEDKLVITILEDGTVKVETDKIGSANHLSADAFLKLLATLTGGSTKAESKQNHGHTHVHTRNEEKQ